MSDLGLGVEGAAPGADTVLPSRILDRLAERGERPALLTVAAGAVREVAAAELARDARRLAGWLLAEGVGRGEPVLLLAPNGLAWVTARLAAGLAGALPIAIDDVSTPAEVETLAADSGARFVFTTGGHVAAVPPLDGAPRRIVRLDLEAAEGGWRGLGTTEPAAFPVLAPDEPAMLVYTSGTTGKPKGFTLTHANLHANVAGVLAQRMIGPDDRMMLPLPLHHVYPFLIGLLCPLAAGSAVVFPEGVTGPQIVQALTLGRATAMAGVPRLYTALLAGLEARVAAQGGAARLAFRGLLAAALRLRKAGFDPGRPLFAGLRARLAPDLRLMVSGGAKLDEEYTWKLEALGWRVLNGYGLAETASMFTGNVPGRQRVGSEGLPIAAGSEVRIADPDATGTGEIQLRGPNVFAGYRDNAEANAAAFQDGWFRTGDLGRVDADGFVSVTGRLKEMLVLGGGKNIFPDELEPVYTAHPAIRELAVLERAGSLVAIVVPDLEAVRAAGNARAEDVVRVALTTAGQGLPGHQRLTGFALAREPLPRTRLGKVQRFRLPALYDALKAGTAPAAKREPSAADLALIERPGAREVWAILMQRYPDRPVAPDAHPLLDLGIDSLEWITLALEIEQRTGVRLAEEEMAELASVRALLERVAAGGSAPATVPAGPSPEELARHIAPAGGAAAPLRALLSGANRLLARLLFRLEVEGREHLPADGPFLVVANHVSDLDPPVMAAALPRAALRRVWWSGAADRLFVGPRQARLAHALHIFPVDERTPGAATGMARAVLERGDGLVWFPESWRSPDGALQRFLPGVGAILDGLDVPVVPAFIHGSYRAMPRTSRWPRPHPIRVAFGPPLRPAALAETGSGPAAPHRIADALRTAVIGVAAGLGVEATEPVG